MTGPLHPARMMLRGAPAAQTPQMTQTRHDRRTLVAGGLLLAALAACGSSGTSSGKSSSGGSTPSPTPAVCGDVDSLQKSVQALKDVSVGQGALATLRTDVDQVKQGVTTLTADARSQYASETAQLKVAVDTLSADVDAAKAGPSAATLAAVAASVGKVATAAEALKTAVKGTC